MRKYGVKLFFTADQYLNLETFYLYLRLLGFTPSQMNINFDTGKSLLDIKYDGSKLLKNISNNCVTAFTLKNQNNSTEDRTDLKWFRFQADYLYVKVLSTEWNNIDVYSLIENDEFMKLISLPSFICGFAYDSDDAFMQSNTILNLYEPKSPSDTPKTKKNDLNQIVVDTSENWGRIERTLGIDFMAAPLMWFGSPFFDLIDREKLLKFPYSVVLKSLDLVFVKLYEVTDSPQMDKNRACQERFWRFFDLVNVIENYKQKIKIDPEEWLKNKLKSRKK